MPRASSVRLLATTLEGTPVVRRFRTARRRGRTLACRLAQPASSASKRNWPTRRIFLARHRAASSSVLTLMSNVMVAPRIGPVRPYALIGAGLIKSHVEASLGSLASIDNNNFGWDIGGGLMLMFGPCRCSRGRPVFSRFPGPGGPRRGAQRFEARFRPCRRRRGLSVLAASVPLRLRGRGGLTFDRPPSSDSTIARGGLVALWALVSDVCQLEFD